MSSINAFLRRRTDEHLRTIASLVQALSCFREVPSFVVQGLAKVCRQTRYLQFVRVHLCVCAHVCLPEGMRTLQT